MSEVAFLVGRTVVEVRVNPAGDARIVFELGSKWEPTLYADVGTGTSTFIDAAGRRHVFSDADASGLVALYALVGGIVADTATDEASLLLRFTDGSSLFCEPHDRYESWQVAGGSPQYLVICVPGGGELAIFDESSPTYTFAPEDAGTFFAELEAKWGRRESKASE